jgi:hypothetical protein
LVLIVIFCLIFYLSEVKFLCVKTRDELVAPYALITPLAATDESASLSGFFILETH